MERIHFTEDMVLGVAQMDDQHRKLIDMINELHAASQEGRDREGVIRTLHAMNNYIDLHFMAEELVMEECGYEGLEDHRKQHRAFVAKVREFSAKFQTGNEIVPAELLAYLADWLINHIKGEDPKYVPCFKAHGM